jgi:hypothetical protein
MNWFFYLGKRSDLFQRALSKWHKKGKGHGVFSQTPVRHEVKEMSLSLEHRMLETDYLLYYKRFSEQANKKCSQPACY